MWAPWAASLESQVWTKHHDEKPLPVLLLSQCKHLCHRSPKGTMCVEGRLPAKSASDTHCWNGGLVREACSRHASRHSPGSTSRKPRPASFCRTQVWILRKKPKPCSSFKKPWRALALTSCNDHYSLTPSCPEEGEEGRIHHSLGERRQR